MEDLTRSKISRATADMTEPCLSAGTSEKTEGDPVRGRRRLSLGQAEIVLLLAMLFFAVVLLCLGTGAVAISPRVLVGALLSSSPLTATDRTILFDLRLPRILAAAIVGAALSIAGLLFQGLFRNPMADPYVIGSSGGAVFGAAIGIYMFSQSSFLGFSTTSALAFLGSLATMALVYALSRSHGRTELVTLLLAGFAISTVLSNATYLFEVVDAGKPAGSRILLSWLRGVIGVPLPSQLILSGSLLCLASVAAIPLMRRMNTLALGDEYAHQLGLPVELTRLQIVLVGSLLTAVAVSLGGLISFAGLIVPHIARLLRGPDNVQLLPVTALGGAIFLVLADTLARTLLRPSEIPVGVLLALVGGPFFLYLLRQAKRGYTL